MAATQPSENNIDRAAAAMGDAAQRLASQQKDPAATAEKKALDELKGDLAKMADLQRRLEEQAAKPDYPKQKQDQDQTKSETDKLAGQMKDQSTQSGSSTPGQDSVWQAGSDMGDASAQLGQSKPSDANKEQKKSLEELDKAREDLKQAIAQEEELAQAETLAKIDALLGVILKTQQAINKETIDTYAQHSGDTYQRPSSCRA